MDRMEQSRERGNREEHRDYPAAKCLEPCFRDDKSKNTLIPPSIPPSPPEDEGRKTVLLLDHGYGKYLVSIVGKNPRKLHARSISIALQRNPTAAREPR